MRAYLRLLGYLRPYRGRLVAALACMVVYAAMSGASLGLVVPFLRVLFERGARPAVTALAPVTTSPSTHGVTPGGTPAVASPGTNRLVGWPEPMQRLAQRWLLNARPLVALERVCVF